LTHLTGDITGVRQVRSCFQLVCDYCDLYQLHTHTHICDLAHDLLFDWTD